MGLPFSSNDVALNAVTSTVANTAAYPFDYSKRQLKSIQFTASGISTGNGVFGVEVSNDGTNWVVYNRLVRNLEKTNAQQETYTAAPTLSTNTSSIYFFPVGDFFRFMRVFVTVTSDGSYSAVVEAAG